MNFFGNRYTSSPRPTVESRSNAFQGTNKFLLLYVTSEILLEPIQEKKTVDGTMNLHLFQAKFL